MYKAEVRIYVYLPRIEDNGMYFRVLDAVIVKRNL